MGQAFQFTPGGVVPIVDPMGIDATAMHGASAAPAPYDPEAIPDEPAPVARVTSTQALSKPIAKVAAALPTVSPRSVIKAARARVKEIRGELRRLRALQKELGQLERMLTATKKPLASLTPINSRRVG